MLIDPLHEEFGWSHGVIGFAVSINLILFGLFSPFAAALMDRFGIRRVLCVALILIAAGSSLTVFVTQPWHLWLLWGVVVGLGAGSMSVAFIAVLVSRWFVTQRGLVTGMLTAASATGQLVFLPVIAWLATQYGWRVPALIVASGALLVLPLVFVIIRDHPSDLGLDAYGATEADPPRRSRSARGTLR